MTAMTDDLPAHVDFAGLAFGVDAGMVGRDGRRHVSRDRVAQGGLKRRMARKAALEGVADTEDNEAKGERSPDAKAPGTR